MDRESPRDPLDAALQGVVGVRVNGGHELPWPPAGPERSWVLTGQGSADRRRAQGSSTRLRRLLVGQALPRGREGQWGDFSRAMERSAVTEALVSLPAELREVVRMAYFQGMTNRAVADHLGLSVAGVRRRLRQALRQVEGQLRRAGSSLSGTLVAIGSGWLDRASQGRDVVVAAAGTVAATTAVVFLAGGPTLAVASAQTHRAPAAELRTSSAGSAPANRFQAPAAAAANPGPPAAGAATGKVDAGAAPAAAPSAGLIPPPVALPVTAPVQVPVPGLPAVAAVVQAAGPVTTQVASGLPPAPAIKPLGR